MKTSEGSDRRMDVVVPDWESPGREIWIDISVTNPLSETRVREASTKKGSAAMRADKAKRAKYRSDVVAKGGQVKLVPCIIESPGHMGNAFAGFMKKISQRAETTLGIPKAWFLHSWRARIQCALQKGNTNVLLSSTNKVFSKACAMEGTALGCTAESYWRTMEAMENAREDWEEWVEEE